MMDTVRNGINTYKLESIHTPMLLEELVDVPVHHPLRCHRKVLVAHCRSQQWEHIRVAEAPPRQYFFAEPLCDNQDLWLCGLRAL